MRHYGEIQGFCLALVWKAWNESWKNGEDQNEKDQAKRWRRGAQKMSKAEA